MTRSPLPTRPSWPGPAPVVGSPPGPAAAEAADTLVPTVRRHSLGTTPAIDLTVLDVDGATYQLVTRPAVAAPRKRATRPSKAASAPVADGPDVAHVPEEAAKALVGFVAVLGPRR